MPHWFFFGNPISELHVPVHPFLVSRRHPPILTKLDMNVLSLDSFVLNSANISFMRTREVGTTLGSENLCGHRP